MREKKHSSPDQIVLVTGASGFIGKALCQALLAVGHSVRGGTRSETAMEALGHDGQSLNQGRIPLTEKGRWIGVGDIGPDTEWSGPLSGVTTVVHLAAQTQTADEGTLDSLAEFRRVNVSGTERLARSAVASQVRRLIFVSSAKVNGEATGLCPDGRCQKFSEKDTPNPRDDYALSKWEAEKVLRRIEGESGLEVVIIRPPLVYGPGVRGNFLRLIRIVQLGAPIPLARAKNRRSFVFVGNLVDAIVTCVSHPKAAGKTFLVSDGEDVSTPELIRLIASALDRKPRLIPVPLPLIYLVSKLTGKSADLNRLVESLVLDSSLIEAELGWKPPCSMVQGLEETARWFRSLSLRMNGRV